jgi:hypothetical protein
MAAPLLPHLAFSERSYLLLAQPILVVCGCSHCNIAPGKTTTVVIKVRPIAKSSLPHLTQQAAVPLNSGVQYPPPPP